MVDEVILQTCGSQAEALQTGQGFSFKICGSKGGLRNLEAKRAVVASYAC